MKIPQDLKLTNLNKVFWPEEGYTKGDVINYYVKMAPYILPYLKDRPESLNRYPGGIRGESFYQKNMEFPPPWLKTVLVKSEHEGRDINYLVCNDQKTLLYMANLGCIEINPWASRLKSLNKPDFAIFDIDPHDVDFVKTIQVTLKIKEILDYCKIKSYCKTSGKIGLHIYIPLAAKYSYEQARQFVEIVMRITQKSLPEITSVESRSSEKVHKVYLDYLRNARGATAAAPYCLRPIQGARVSTPLEWDEVNEKLDVATFNVATIFDRLEKKGDIFNPILKQSTNLASAIKKLATFR